MNTRFVELNNTFKVLAQHTEEISHLKTEVCSLQKVVQEQQIKLDDFEDRSRRRNLIIFGIPEIPDENHSALKEHVVDKIFREKLEVVAKTVERVHRVGKKKTDNRRPVILNFFDYNEKMAVLRNCSKLKGSKFSINHDFCKNTLAKRSNLWKYGKQFKDQGRKVTLDYDRLHVDNTTYVWDEAKSCAIPSRQSKPSTNAIQTHQSKFSTPS
ncbi:uncharacterized protein LOC144152415 [Haemaphysalis longicornis]